MWPSTLLNFYWVWQWRDWAKRQIHTITMPASHLKPLFRSQLSSHWKVCFCVCCQACGRQWPPVLLMFWIGGIRLTLIVLQWGLSNWQAPRSRDSESSLALETFIASALNSTHTPYTISNHFVPVFMIIWPYLYMAGDGYVEIGGNFLNFWPNLKSYYKMFFVLNLNFLSTVSKEATHTFD